MPAPGALVVRRGGGTEGPLMRWRPARRRVVGHTCTSLVFSICICTWLRPGRAERDLARMFDPRTM